MTSVNDVATARLGDFAHTRSGDKGNRANIAVIAFDAERYEHLRAYLTEAAVAEFFRPMSVGAVKRYEMPKIRAFNLVIDDALAGGASRSLRLDTQGKALGEAIKELRLPKLGSD